MNSNSSTTEKNSQQVDTVRLQKLSRAFIESAALFAAIDLELFTAIARGSNTAQKFAEFAEITPTNADRLMTMCATMGLLEWSEQVYRNAPDVERFLVKDNEKYAGPWLQFSRAGWQRWGNLTEILSNPAPASVLGTYSDMSVESARRYHTATASVGFGSGRRFARQVDLSNRHKMMDLGGGSGAYSIVAVETYPELEAVVFDLPPVVKVTREFVERHNLKDRIKAVGGDFTRDVLPQGCDVVVMASNLPQYSADIIQQVVSKAFGALLPGGEMHLIGEMLDDERRGPVDAAIWGLNEALSNSTGVAHTRRECVDFFNQAGFTNVSVVDFIPDILVRVSGRKPG